MTDSTQPILTPGFSGDDLKQIAFYQAGICWLVFARLAIMALAFLLAKYKSPFSDKLIAVDPFVSVGFIVLAVIFVYGSARALKKQHPWIYCIGTLPPIVSLIVIVHLVLRSTQVLRAHNIKVGLMGANARDFRVRETQDLNSN